ncbi:MAG: arginase family protein [Chloroflexota bacterium]
MSTQSIPSLTSSAEITQLQVIGIRYRRSTLAPGDERSLDAYSDAQVYSAANVPYQIVEPRFPDAQRVEDEPRNLGTLGGKIADVVASARQENKAILMTGGDCCHITGIFGGLQDVHGPQVKVGLVWLDAHGDFNTPNTTLSGMLGGMPVAVCAGLAYPQWREGSHIVSPLPTDRILMVDVRNLDPAEEQLIRATDVAIVSVDPNSSSQESADSELQRAVNTLSSRCDLIYLHIDSDILDESYVPNHGTKEPNGPNMAQVQSIIGTVMATGKVAVLAVVSVYGEGEGREKSVESGIELIRSGLNAWSQYGMG